MNKQKQLAEVAAQIARCKICREDKQGLPVPGEGNPDADIVFLGEAPGKNEAATGRPFIGRSGQLLRRMIQKIGLKEEDVFITSPVKYLPDRGTPTRAHIQHGRVHLSKQLDVIEPKVIVLLGNTAIYALLDRHLPALKEHGNIVSENGRKYLLTIHPAAVLRFPKYAPVMHEDFQKILSLI